MNIGLFWPYGNDCNSVFPLSIGYLASNIDLSNNEIHLFDHSLDNIHPVKDRDKLNSILVKQKLDIIGISCDWSFNYRNVLNTLEIINEVCPESTVIMGGCHATLNAVHIMQTNRHVEYIIKGEAEFSFPQLIKTFTDGTNEDKRDKIPGLVWRDNGEIKSNSLQYISDLDTIKPVNYQKLRIREYAKRGYRYGRNDFGLSAPIWISRGCPYNCTFCAATMMNGKRVRYHSIPYIANLITQLYENENIRTFAIIDDNFTFDMNYCKSFCQTIINLKLKDVNVINPNGIRIDRLDQELICLMREAGWKVLTVAIETGNENTMERIKKKINLRNVSNYISMIKKEKLLVHSNFMLGIPGTDLKENIDTVEFACTLNIDMVGFPKFQPLPGTILYNELVVKNEIKSDFIPTGYNMKAKYAPQGMSPSQLDKLQRKAYINFYLRHPFSLFLLFKYYSVKHLLTYISRVIFRMN